MAKSKQGMIRKHLEKLAHKAARKVVSKLFKAILGN